PRQRHAGDHGHHVRVLVPRRHLQSRRRPPLRVARPEDLLPLAMSQLTRRHADGAPIDGENVGPDSMTAGALSGEHRIRRAPGVRSLWTETWRRFRRHRLAIFGATVMVVMVTAVVVGPFVYRVPIDEIDFKAKLKGPTRLHPLGTDD